MDGDTYINICHAKLIFDNKKNYLFAHFFIHWLWSSLFFCIEKGMYTAGPWKNFETHFTTISISLSRTPGKIFWFSKSLFYWSFQYLKKKITKETNKPGRYELSSAFPDEHAWQSLPESMTTKLLTVSRWTCMAISAWKYDHKIAYMLGKISAISYYFPLEWQYGWDIHSEVYTLSWSGKMPRTASSSSACLLDQR